MAEFPSLPLFTDAWVADTKHLTRLERGTYHDLLVLMWRTPDCRVPNDDVWLGKRLGMTVDEVRSELRPLIAEFCQNDGNYVFQKRLSKEWEWCRNHSKKQSGNAKSRWNKKKDICQSDAKTTTSGNAPTPIPTPTPKEDSVAVATDAVASPVYTDSRHELWGEGVAILRQLGESEKSARSNIGRWLRSAKDDCPVVLGAIQRARDHRIIDPVPWITRSIATNEAPHGKQPQADKSISGALGRAREAAAGLLRERPEIGFRGGEGASVIPLLSKG